jgi:hypothetical protein
LGVTVELLTGRLTAPLSATTAVGGTTQHLADFDQVGVVQIVPAHQITPALADSRPMRIRVSPGLTV